MSGEKIMLILVVAFIASSQSIICPKFQCGSSFPNSNQCIYFDSTNKATYISSCSKGTYCPPTNQANSTCQTVNPKPISRSYPGEKCSSNTNCITGVCSKDVCSGIARNQNCSLNITNNALCEPGNYCDLTLSNPVCTELKSNLAFCTAGDQCIYGAGCYNNTYCLLYGSIQNYQIIAKSECTNAIGYSPYCQSGQCYNFVNGTSICIEAFESPYFDSPFQCYENSACVSNINIKTGAAIQGACNCAKNTEGSAFCAQFVGDYYFSRAIELWEKWEKSGNPSKCNIDAAYTPGCLMSYYKSNDAYEILYYNYLATNYPTYVGADNCTLNVYFSDYLFLVEEYNPINSSGNQVFGLALVIALALA
ncbi:hypothetical protein SteCoe_33547 [Stentor coeruleus]|uniref:Uncharacterized protein n=1 Tax=Stentor coeruleus TaxID=5963 RepID=A0A1R2AWJ3_9CILI|nr:hypothetical protein SteCoe_33547 [Stentor coeruleus]